jgi:hypothetical protein
MTLSGIETRDLPAFSNVPEPIALWRAPFKLDSIKQTAIFQETAFEYPALDRCFLFSLTTGDVTRCHYLHCALAPCFSVGCSTY